MMKLHAPTETLVFSGNPTQLEAVSRALKALEPTPDEVRQSKQMERAGNDRDRMAMEAARLQEALERTRAEAADVRQRANQQTEEMEKLRARLHALEAPAAPPTGPVTR
jgi:predicted RNase H-like nuclease (RuvC/YqgF family)